MTLFPRHKGMIEALQNRNRYRQIKPASGYDFASNDYLGLANSPVLQKAAKAAIERGVPVGAGGSRLLRGNDNEHEQLEHQAASFFNTERALFMGGGFVANMAIFSALPQKGDIIFFDELVHASAHEGMRLGRAEFKPFKHNDANDLEEKITTWRTNNADGRAWIAIEGVYSMEGDVAPVPKLYRIAQSHDAVLVVDEAHATGLFGQNGRGIADQCADDERVLSLHTCGKALGVSGALICGSAVLIETLINKARGFIFSTAPSPLNAAIVHAALAELQKSDALVKKARAQMEKTHKRAMDILGLAGFQSQIMPIMVGDDGRALALAASLQQKGFDIRAIRPPTVPKNTARLRISLTLNTNFDINQQMLETLGAILSEKEQPR